ncbi:MAG: D-alanyl-D-alanine carboxypeptidase family protein [Robiginitomaculum sp.]|nr:D-alanyl-D-alanine carboxypeptidase family protein [Robiginitomaculum sp.]
MITVTEQENPVDMVEFVESDRLFLNPLETNDWRIRRVVRDKVLQAVDNLPDGLCLMLFDAFRTRDRQWELWNPVFKSITDNNPNWSKDQVYIEASRWVSPPDGLGSGHQAGAAIDIKLAYLNKEELDFGGTMKGLSGVAPTAWPVVPNIRKNRDLLVKLMHDVGMVNYPDEWWHFSYGDRLWAEITGKSKAFFAPIE